MINRHIFVSVVSQIIRILANRVQPEFHPGSNFQIDMGKVDHEE
jgi:hypothetical protein